MFHSGLIAGVMALTALWAAAPALAETVTIEDVTGRTVEVQVPIERVMLGEGRQIYFTAVLDTDNPFKRVVGWRDDLIKADPDGYRYYLEAFPAIVDIPGFGGMEDGTFDLEQAVSLKPDAIVMNIDTKTAIEESGYLDKLAKLGIPLVYVDFRDKPMENTDPSMRIFGKMFGKEERAEEFIKFRNAEIDRVRGRLARAGEIHRPTVFIERAAGYSDICCWSFGNENFGKMVEIAGGDNIGRQFIPGTFGTVNPEQVIASDPEHILVTSANWEAYVPGGKWVGVGPGADQAEARRKLAALMDRPAFTAIRAIKDDNVHAIWHQFYNSPYQFVAVQQIAKWLHPDLFQDLDPDATFRELHDRFLPIDYHPGYFASLSSGS